MNLKKATILVIEDESTLRKLFAMVLEAGGYHIIECGTGKEGVRLALSKSPDCVILDLSLPDMEGNDVITLIRGSSEVPIVVCSLNKDNESMVNAFEYGADDYVTKPFSPDFLLARLRINLQKNELLEASLPKLTNGAITVDTAKREVFVKGVKTSLTPYEFDLLVYFMNHRDKILTHQEILQNVWNNLHNGNHQYLRVYVNRLRDKIEPDNGKPVYITTQNGIGYCMEVVNGR